MRKLNETARSIHLELSKIDLKKAGISEYNQRYLSTKIKDPQIHWPINTYMMSWLLNIANVAPKDSVLIDYGGGSGTISLLAKKLWVGIVIYCDIYDVSCKDAQVIGNLLGCEADFYVEGDINDLINFCHSSQLNCNIFASHDCIEHIYNIESFLRSIKDLSTGRILFWLSSSANTLRRKTRRTLEKQQIRCEIKDREAECGHKERDTLRSFISIRKEMIRKVSSELDEREVEELAKRSRGLMREDILILAQQYLSNRLLLLPPKPMHPTNTCDPYTGNWIERLMDPFYLKKILEDSGSSAEIKTGYWDTTKNPMWKTIIKCILNILLSVLGKKALFLAPYYILCGISNIDAEELTANSHRRSVVG